MSLFDLPFRADSPPRPILARVPRGPLAALAGVLALAMAVEHAIRIDPNVLPVAGVAVGHGALLMLAFANADPGWGRPTLVVIGLLGMAAALSRESPWGGLAYLLVPAAVWELGRRRPALGAMGITTPVTVRASLVGVLGGLCLGAHLLISASRTLGHPAGVVPIGSYLAAVAYDVGANVVSAECFFRGALFDGLQRRFTFGLAAVVTTLAEVLRYLLDPSLPKTVEMIAGAMFYVALLGLVSCALFRWSGSLVPGALGRLTFFAAYRAL